MKYLLGAITVVSLGAASAAAQTPSPPPPATPAPSPAPGSSAVLAEQLFNQGRDLAKANQWAEACPKFEASLRYDPVLGTRLNLATCYERIGRLASAWGLYRESIELAKKAGDTKRAEYAQRQAAALEPRLPKLAISAPASPPAGFVVKRDDTAVDAGALGTALYVDPGVHKVIASAPGFETFTVSVTVAEGKTETLAIPALTAKPTVAKLTDSKSVIERDTVAPAPASRTRTYVALGLGGGGLAAVGVGLVFGAKARSRYNEAAALCGDDLACPAGDLDRGKRLVKDARSSAAVSTVLVIGGSAAIAAGAVVYLTGRRPRERSAARLVPVTHNNGAGVALVGMF